MLSSVLKTIDPKSYKLPLIIGFLAKTLER